MLDSLDQDMLIGGGVPAVSGERFETHNPGDRRIARPRGARRRRMSTAPVASARAAFEGPGGG
jgi:hypothetical protein